MKTTHNTSTLLALLTLSTLTSTAYAAEPVTVISNVICPPDTTQLANPQGFGVSPRPGIVLSYSNTTTSAEQVFVSLVLPGGTTFLAFRDAPAGIQKWRSTADNLLYDAPIPTDGSASEVGVFFTLGASQSGSFTVVLDDAGNGSVQLKDYSARVAPDTFVPYLVVPAAINTNSCPTPVQVLKCLGSNATCGVNRGYLAGVTFDLSDAADDALSPAAATSPPTDASGVTFVATYTDGAFLNGIDATNDSYPLRGVTYTITETLPADTLPDGPTWFAVTGLSRTLEIPTAVPGPLGYAQTEFVNDCNCVNYSCQAATCQLKTDGSGLAECVYVPTNGGCDDFEPNVCAQGGTCFEGECIAVTPSCDTMTFFGVVENADDSLSSFECQITTTSGSESIACRVAGGGFAATGELVLGGPQCVANDPPVLNATQFALDVAPATQDVDPLGFDPNGDVLGYTVDDGSLPSAWSIDGTTGIITIAANAIAGTYVINVTVSDGLSPQIFPVTVVLTAPPIGLADKQVFVLPLSQSAYGDTSVAFADRASAYGFADTFAYVDALCQVAGETGSATNHGSTWRAWLSDTSADAIDRINDGRFVRAFDGAVIATSKADLVTSKTLPQEGGSIPLAGMWIHVPIKYTHNGVLDWPQGGGGAIVATGTLENGRRVMGAPSPGTATNCLNWSSTSNAVTLAIGINASQDARWTGHRNSSTCERADYRIYCFEQ